MSSLNSRAGWKYGNVGASTGISEMSHGNINGLSMKSEIGKRVSVMQQAVTIPCETGVLTDSLTTGIFAQGGQQVFIDVESHEMVDVLESDKHPLPSPSDSEMLKMYAVESRVSTEKQVRMSVGQMPSRPSGAR